MDFKKRPTFNGADLALVSEVGTGFPGYGASTPAGLGTAAVGVDATASRSDHVHSSTVAGTLDATAVRVGTDVITRVFTVVFPDGVANQKVDLTFGSFAGELDVTVAAYYNSANAAGSVTKRFAGYWQNSAGTPVYHMARTHYTDALGNTPEHFAISNVGWTSPTFKITIAHRVSTGNTVTVVVHAKAAPGFATAIAAATLGAVYTTDTTVYDAPQVHYDTAFRFGGGYGSVSPPIAGAAAVVFGAGGASPNAGSVCWGDGSGWQLTFGPNLAGTYTPRIHLSDAGRIGIGAQADTGLLDAAATKTYTSFPFSGDIPVVARNLDATTDNWSEIGFRGSGTALGAGIAARHIDHTNNYADLSLWTRSAAGMVNRLNIASTGAVTIGGRLGVGAAPTGAMTSVVNTTAAEHGLIVRGAAAQTASLTRWENSAGTALAHINAAGDLTLPATSFAAPTDSTPGDSVAAGTATTFARSDHTHAREIDLLAPVAGVNATSTNTITATAFATLPNPVSTSLTVATTTLVLINLNAWIVCSAGGGGDLRVSVNITGATTVTANPTGMDPMLDNFTWSHVLFVGSGDGTASVQRAITRYVHINAGTTTFTVQAYKTGTPATAQVNYPCLTVVPLHHAAS